MDHIGDLLDRPKLYYNIDGVGELGMGVMCLGYSVLGWLQLRAPADSAWHQMYVFIIYVGSMCAVLHYGTKAVKKHITYPRTGYVAYRRTWRPLILTAPAARSRWDMALAVLIGLVLAATYAYRIARSVPWKWAVAAAMTLGSMGIAVLPADLLGALASETTSAPGSLARFMAAFYLSMTSYGALLLLSGGISFRLYLHRTQPPARDAQ